MNDRDDLRWRLVFAALHALVRWTHNRGEDMSGVEAALLDASKGEYLEPKW